MSLAAKLRPTFEAAEDRQSPRTRMLLGGTARQGEGVFQDITVHDLSRDGFRVESAMELTPGATVEVDLPGVGPREATVMWAGHPYAGCAFATPLLREQLRVATEASPVVWGSFGETGDNPAQARALNRSLADLVSTDAAPEPVRLPKLSFGKRARAIVAIDVLLWIGVVSLAWALFG
jgi:hypothetical protein